MATLVAGSMGTLNTTKVGFGEGFLMMYIQFEGEQVDGLVCTIVGTPGDPLPEYLEEVVG